jgi:hypothetical protein
MRHAQNFLAVGTLQNFIASFQNIAELAMMLRHVGRVGQGFLSGNGVGILLPLLPKDAAGATLFVKPI